MNCDHPPARRTFLLIGSQPGVNYPNWVMALMGPFDMGNGLFFFLLDQDRTTGTEKQAQPSH